MHIKFCTLAGIWKTNKVPFAHIDMVSTVSSEFGPTRLHQQHPPPPSHLPLRFSLAVADEEFANLVLNSGRNCTNTHVTRRLHHPPTPHLVRPHLCLGATEPLSGHRIILLLLLLILLRARLLQHTKWSYYREK